MAGSRSTPRPTRHGRAGGALRGRRAWALLATALALAAFACTLPGARPTPTAPPAAADGAPSVPEPAQVEAEPSGPPVPLTGDALASIAFPRRWNYTAIKTANLLPPPTFLGLAELGALLPWSVDVAETCIGDDCTYTSEIRPFITEGIIGEMPWGTWEVDGRDWSLETSWQSTQSDFGNGTVCVIANNWKYEFTVQEVELVAGRPIARAVIGTWTIDAALDLGASTGDTSACGNAWSYAEAWSAVARTGGAWGDVELSEQLAPQTPLSARDGTARFEVIASSDTEVVETEFTTQMDVVIDDVLGSIIVTSQSESGFSGTSFGPIFTILDVGGKDRIGFLTTGVGPESNQMLAGFITPHLDGKPMDLPDLAAATGPIDIDLLIDAWGFESEPLQEDLVWPEMEMEMPTSVTNQMLQMIYTEQAETSESRIDPSYTPPLFLNDMFNAPFFDIDTEEQSAIENIRGGSTDFFGRWFELPPFDAVGLEAFPLDRTTEFRIQWPLDL